MKPAGVYADTLKYTGFERCKLLKSIKNGETPINGGFD
jgi:hypothetical protein